MDMNFNNNTILIETVSAEQQVNIVRYLCIQMVCYTLPSFPICFVTMVMLSFLFLSYFTSLQSFHEDFCLGQRKGHPLVMANR